MGVPHPGATIDLESWLGDYARELERLELDKWHLYEQRELAGPGWKVAFDGYLESYHIQALHRTTFAPTSTSNLMVVDSFGPHQRILYPVKSLKTLRDIPVEDWDPAAHCGTVYTVFPNVSIASTPGRDTAWSPRSCPDRAWTAAVPCRPS